MFLLIFFSISIIFLLYKLMKFLIERSYVNLFGKQFPILNIIYATYVSLDKKNVRWHFKFKYIVKDIVYLLITSKKLFGTHLEI